MHKHYYIYSVFDSKPFIIIISLWCTFMYAFDDVHDNSMSFPGISQSINHFYWKKKEVCIVTTCLNVLSMCEAITFRYGGPFFIRSVECWKWINIIYLSAAHQWRVYIQTTPGFLFSQKVRLSIIVCQRR